MWIRSYGLLVICWCLATSSAILIDSKVGQCPTSGLRDISQCPGDQTDECDLDEDCSGSSRCCSDGCRRVCIMPVLSSCEKQRVEIVKRARALDLPDNEIAVPECNKVGDFKPVQCNPLEGHCFCVDKSGLERPGTRARSLEFVNCTNPRPCAGFVCRMLCPYEFELDAEGCPLCQCRDPCRGIKCPGSQMCQLEEVPCDEEPCPPLPTCKKARSLDSYCPMGIPLMMPGGGGGDAVVEKPFLCGTDPGKPTCPDLYDCLVQPGADYGLCCPAANRLQKPGTCPAEDHANATMCGVPCDMDLQCQGADKCCHSTACGKHCIPPQNFTVCLQQKMITEMLSVRQEAGMGYVPQCTEEGQFQPRQCSRNGLVCWCVDSQGRKIKGSMGSADGVICNEGEWNAVGRSLCDSTLCSSTCEFGYRVDARGCATCECDQPCDHYPCPEGQECAMVHEEACKGRHCPTKPTCKPKFVEPCAFGKYLTNMVTGKAISCSVGSRFSCPSGYNCVNSLANQANYCCPDKPKTALTKEGVCPVLNESHCNDTLLCGTDHDCPGILKCCQAGECGPVCAEPEHPELLPPRNFDLMEPEKRLPSICELLRDISVGKRGIPAGLAAALAPPKCTETGEYEKIQCHGNQCWCVDEFGIEIPNSRGAADSVTTCQRSRSELDCPGMTCRLGCDFGFVRDNSTNCPLCECRNPCSGITCGAGQVCQMVSTPCEEESFCPPLPFCVVAVKRTDSVCPEGEPFLNLSTDTYLECNPRSRALSCPDGYSCTSDEDSTTGVCCPNTKEIAKVGQCPYLTPMGASCDFECASDAQCEGTTKCCSNGCGTQCVDPVLKTSCQHQLNILKYAAREQGIPANRVFLPRCLEDGRYALVQCDPLTRACWCVNNAGLEVAGTRVPPGLDPTCQQPRECPAFNCSLSCVHGFHIDASGCPECRCHNPCQAMNCRSFEECQLVSLHCVQEPCPPVAMCVPKPANPCGPNGQPLKRANGQLAACGAMEEACPSSHKCHLSPLGQFAVCCPKPREVCFQERDIGSCKSSVLRWSFNDKRNKCEPFRYTGCGGNMNSFASEQDCKTVCPVLSTCEKMREKNSKAAEKYKKVVFMPKCSLSGDWDLIQCLEEVGICWCVDKDGEPIKGSLTRGTPTCGVRQARHRSFDPDICEEGQTVHVCPKDLCSKRVCLGHPKAVCRVNPCNGCHAVFYDGNGRQVDCNSSLTPCQRETQTILNSMRVLEIPASFSFGFASPFWTPEIDAEEFRPSRNGLERALVFHDGNEGIPKLPVTSILTVAQRNKRTTNGDEDDVVTSPIDDGLLGEFDEFTLGDFAIEIDSWENEEKEKTAELKPVNWEPTTAVPKLLPALRDAIKPGFCPFVRPNSILRFLTQFGDQVKCEDKCISDADCHGHLRCCPSTCGTLCTAPMLVPWNANPAPATPLSMTLTPPQCTSLGDYAREQQQGVLSWCVNTDGRPIDDSLTRGSVKCSPSGTILEQRPLGTVCTDPAIVPQVCHHQCLEARCYAHPDAICVADPCEECSVRFVTANGEPVDCQSKCTQPQSSGYCRAAFQRYFYNTTAQQCQEFIFSGCAGNENNFYSLEECQMECEKPVDVCELPKEEGLCRASFARWYYNSDTRQCEEFYFGGCGGNPNNFETKQQCESRCPDFVLCPRMSENGDVRGCQRSAVCNDSLTCPGHEEFVCVVDPCTCQARFTDYEGSPIQCQQAVPVTTTVSTTTAATSTTTTTTAATTTSTTTSTPAPTTTSITMKSTTSHVPEVFVEARKGHVSDKPSIESVSTTKTSTTTSKIGVIIKDQGLVGTIEHKPVKKWVGKRGKSLQVDKITRCQKMRNNQETNQESYLVECDALGKFKPLQCVKKQSAQEPVQCWCVDEAGNQLPNSTLFLKDTQTCQYVPVTAVAVSLGFADGHEMQMDQSSMEEALQSQMGELLQMLEASTMKETVVVQDRPQDPRIEFTLIGENTVDVASQIEDMVKSGYLVFELAGHSMAADLTSSQFHHRVGQPRIESLNPESLTVMGNREILAEALNIEAPYLAIIILFSVLAVMTICGVIIGVVLYRRKTTGTYPKGTKVTLGYPHSPRGPAKQKQAQLHNNGTNVHAHRGFPRVGISPAEQEYSSNQQQYPHLSPTIPRSNRLGLKENKEAW